MARYKGRPSSKAVERDYPHIVEMPVPPMGFGRDLAAMHCWHSVRGLVPRNGQGKRVEDTDIVRWCFATPEAADAFREEFGGERLTASPPLKRLVK